MIYRIAPLSTTLSNLIFKVIPVAAVGANFKQRGVFTFTEALVDHSCKSEAI